MGAAFLSSLPGSLTVTKTLDPALEAIHLVSLLLARFNSVCQECELTEQELYVLAFIRYRGDLDNGVPYLLRSDVTKLLKLVFDATDAQTTNWVQSLLSARLLQHHTFSDSKSRLFATKGKLGKGRTGLILTDEGQRKLARWLELLSSLKDDVLKEGYLSVPAIDERGSIAGGIVYFLELVTPTTDGAANIPSSQINDADKS